MGVQNISCKCIKTCKDISEEVDLAKSDYLRSRSGNLKINNDPKNLAPFQQKNITFNTEKNENASKNDKANAFKSKETFQNQIIEEEDENKYTETNNNAMNISKKNDKNEIEKEEEKETDKEKEEEKEISKESKENIEKKEKDFENKKNGSFENSIIKDNKNKNENENNELSRPSSVSSIRFIKNFDKSFFITDKLKNAEKNFERPINYHKDWAQYCDQSDNEDMLILIDAMNSNKGENHTKEEGQVIEQKGERFLYIGELDKNQKPSGFGVLYTSHGDKYEGNFSKGKLIGIGRYIDAEGTCYEGIFEYNKLVSKAKIIKNNKKNKKVTYFGEIQNLKKNGKGEEFCEGEYRYNGDFVNDLWEGKGRLEYLDSGDIYEGDFKKGEFNGKGLLIWRSNNNQYKGDFVNGVMHGKGKYKWADGFEYEGDYNNGIKEGMGTYKYNDGRVFKGRFKDGKPDGKGKFIYKGRTINVEYKNGKPLQDIKKLFQSYSKDITSQ